VHDEQEKNDRIRLTIAGAVAGTLAAVAAYALGVQELLRVPGLVLYLPAAVFGAAVGATRLRHLVWVPATVIAALCVLVAYTPLVVVLSRPLIRTDPLPQHVDAIAVLSNGFELDGSMRHETLDRLLTGFSLAHQGLASVVTVSRESRVVNGLLVSDSADLDRVAVLAAGSAKIIFVDSVFTTRTEALRIKDLARANHWQTIAVVTSPMHTTRACATFEAVGLRIVCVPALVRESGLYQGANAEDRLRAFRSWLYEVFASATYASRGWIR
jgi:uncharacterized SAM-binding protein YcdF (DUF218 family)